MILNTNNQFQMSDGTLWVFQELLNKFREKKVDFAAHTNTEDGSAVFLNLLGQHSLNLRTVGQLDVGLSFSPDLPCIPFLEIHQ